MYKFNGKAMKTIENTRFERVTQVVKIIKYCNANGEKIGLKP